MTAPSSRPQWETTPLSELIHYIVSHYHEQLRSEFPELIALADAVEARHTAHPFCPTGLRAHLEAMHQSALDHLAKEERVLFPMILEGYGCRTGGPVRVMEIEHDAHITHLAQIHQLTHNLTAPEGADEAWRVLYTRLAAFERAFLQHIELENTVLFPRALNDD
jgi:regulator of cell morphogenesis and NO signaling